MFSKHSPLVIAVLVLASCSSGFAQFGGHDGDTVIYAVTYNGNGAFQANPAATNTAANLANFKVVDLDSVPFTSGAPFPLQRQIFYATDTETFQVGTDVETTVGLHRIFVSPVKILQIEGFLNAVGNLIGNPPSLISFPLGLDAEGDVALTTLKVITWFPKAWPFIALIDGPGPIVPPGVNGFAYLFSQPNALKLPSLMTWTEFSAIYTGAGWTDGVDIKLLDQDPGIGDTIEFIRIRPGKSTPVFRLAGHTHLFVLQGSATITPAGGSTSTMAKYSYAFLPENFAVTLANPAPYIGPGVN